MLASGSCRVNAPRFLGGVQSEIDLAIHSIDPFGAERSVKLCRTGTCASMVLALAGRVSDWTQSLAFGNRAAAASETRRPRANRVSDPCTSGSCPMSAINPVKDQRQLPRTANSRDRPVAAGRVATANCG